MENELIQTKTKLENLTEIKELMDILGYSDERSAKKWCQKNKVILLKIGLKKYILTEALQQIIDEQLIIFSKTQHSGNAKIIDINRNQSADGNLKVNTGNAPAKPLQRKYKPNNKLVSHYLTKYESTSKSKTA